MNSTAKAHAAYGSAGGAADRGFIDISPVIDGVAIGQRKPVPNRVYVNMTST